MFVVVDVDCLWMLSCVLLGVCYYGCYCLLLVFCVCLFMLLMACYVLWLLVFC